MRRTDANGFEPSVGNFGNIPHPVPSIAYNIQAPEPTGESRSCRSDPSGLARALRPVSGCSGRISFECAIVQGRQTSRLGQILTFDRPGNGSGQCSESPDKV